MEHMKRPISKPTQGVSMKAIKIVTRFTCFIRNKYVDSWKRRLYKGAVVESGEIIMYDPIRVTEYLLYKKNGRLTPMQVIKLVYFAHGWTLKLTKGTPLINESIEAWRWGPVVRSIYDEYKHHGNEFIGGKYKKKRFEKFGDLTTAVLDRILDVYGHKNGLELSAMTHQDDTPWHKIYVDQKQHAGDAVIPDDLIEEYFNRVLRVKSNDRDC